MDVKKVVEELKAKYPGKNIIFNNPKEPTEILCEVDPSTSHPEYSVAISVIDRSLEHFHLKTTEEYTVIKGNLTITVDEEGHSVPEGQSYVIYPPQHHFAKGKETWIECKSTPGWTFDDQILVQ